MGSCWELVYGRERFKVIRPGPPSERAVVRHAYRVALRAAASADGVSLAQPRGRTGSSMTAAEMDVDAQQALLRGGTVDAEAAQALYRAAASVLDGAVRGLPASGGPPGSGGPPE